MTDIQKVAIFARNDSFLQPIIRELKNRNTIVKVLTYDNQLKAMDLLHWADFAFFEFLHQPLQMAADMDSVHCRITARLHGLEFYDFNIRNINWPRVNLITSAPQMIRWNRLKESLPHGAVNHAASEHTINLGVNSAATATPKGTYGHNIAITAFTPLPRKRLYTTVESFFDLLLQTRKWGNNCPWHLNIRGLDVNRQGYRGEEAREYVAFIEELQATAAEIGLCDTDPLPITAHNYLAPPDWSRFLSGMDCIIDNSMQEGYHISVLEAMAHGVMPFVHRWIGAELIYPESCLFLTQRELVDKILYWEALPLKDKERISLELQQIVREKHDENVLAKQTVDVILGVAQ